jgi:hypothetical protein
MKVAQIIRQGYESEMPLWLAFGKTQQDLLRLYYLPRQFFMEQTNGPNSSAVTFNCPQ